MRALWRRAAIGARRSPTRWPNSRSQNCWVFTSTSPALFVLDDITLYWLTNTGVSADRIYWENKINLYVAANVPIPAAITVFPGENYQAPRSWAEKAYHKLIYFNEVDKGGHFAAWEQPALFSAELRSAFRSLRQ